MAAGKHFRNEKRTPSFYVLVIIGAFTVLCLFGTWIVSSPEEESKIIIENVSTIMNDLSNEKIASGARESEENISDIQQKIKASSEQNSESKLSESIIIAGLSSEEDVLKEEPGREEKHDGQEVIAGKENGQQFEGLQEANDSHNQWKLCDFEGATDYIPCLDNWEAIRKLPSTKHYEHHERHCPRSAPTCLVPMPEGYQSPIEWPASRNVVWYRNVPHPGLISSKKDQSWVKMSGDKLIFPGGGIQFKNGVSHYIEFVEQTLPDIAFGNHTRVMLDVGCGVASFGGYMLDKEVLTMSFAPKDEHDAQIQLALERGIPAISAVMGTQRLPFPSNVFDAVHCARCRVPWHTEAGKLLLELNRVLRPGGYFVWSATAVYLKATEDRAVWKETVALTAAMCWELAAKTTDSSTGVGIAIFHKPISNFCYENRKKNYPPMCDASDDSDTAWYIPISACIHRIPSEENGRDAEWPEEWPSRLTSPPAWLSKENGRPMPNVADFHHDTERWQRVVKMSYLRKFGIDWSRIRNVMDLNAVYGGFAAALSSQPLWVMNVVPYDAPNTLPVIYDRGLFGIYHDWCESFNSYPRTYDLLHSDHIFNKLRKRCQIRGTVVEMDRLLRPQGWAIFREKVKVLEEIESIVRSLQWQMQWKHIQENEGLLVARKANWRPRPSTI